MSQRAIELHQNPWCGVFYLTGGGSGLLAEMLTTPGASATVLEARIPYAAPALTELLGSPPEQAVSAVTARQLAAAAYRRAIELAPASASGHLFGFGGSATLATNRVKSGQHRAHWAMQTAGLTASFQIGFPAEISAEKGAGKSDRQTEEQLLVEAIWRSLNNIFVHQELPAGEPDGHLVTAQPDYPPLLQPTPYKVCVGKHDGLLLLPGSFNPIHDGHRELLTVAEAITGLTGAYELTVRNADKPSLDYITLEERLHRITTTPVWLTNAPNFSAKARLFPGATFVLGVDTLERIGDLRFYQGHQPLLDEALQTLTRCNARFLVFGRLANGNFVTLEDITIPEPLRNLCTSVAESTYRNDLSSTTLRNQSSDKSTWR